MIFPTTYKKDDPSLLAQLKEANKYLPWINEASSKYHIQSCIIAGLGSRESHWGLALKPEGPEGTGDFTPRHCAGRVTAFRSDTLPSDGLGFGRGLMQIDYDWHEFARTGKWQDPRENILYGCSVLADSLKICERRLKSADDKDLLRITISGYNAGTSRVISCILGGGDVDELTSGKNFSADVLNRAGWFQSQGWTDEILMADVLKDKRPFFNETVSC